MVTLRSSFHGILHHLVLQDDSVRWRIDSLRPCGASEEGAENKKAEV